MQKLKSRPVPHDFGEEIADFELEDLVEQIPADHDRVLGGELDDNLPVIFSSLMIRIAEFTCLNYFFKESPVEDVLEGFGKSALASANMFRVIQTSDNGMSKFVWEGVERSVATLEQTDLHNSARIPFGLFMATISGRNEDLEFIASIPRQQYIHPQIKQHEYLLRHTEFLQLLFTGDAGEIGSLVDELEPQLEAVYQKNDPDSEYIKSEARMFFNLAKSDADKFWDSVDTVLQKHKRLFNSQRNNMDVVIMGLLAVSSIAAVVLAAKKGIGFNKELNNPYLPNELVHAALKANGLG